MSDRSCLTCEWYVKPPGPNGFCHLSPPRNVVYQEPRPAMPLLGQPASIEIKIRSVYSIVGPEDWCSRHSLKVVEPLPLVGEPTTEGLLEHV